MQKTIFMKRSNRALIFFTALAVTFGSLFAFAGKENFNRSGFNRHHGWHHCNKDSRGVWRGEAKDSLPQKGL